VGSQAGLAEPGFFLAELPYSAPRIYLAGGVPAAPLSFNFLKRGVLS
jgi:hypothetical protein